MRASVQYSVFPKFLILVTSKNGAKMEIIRIIDKSPMLKSFIAALIVKLMIEKKINKIYGSVIRVTGFPLTKKRAKSAGMSRKSTAPMAKLSETRNAISGLMPA